MCEQSLITPSRTYRPYFANIAAKTMVDIEPFQDKGIHLVVPRDYEHARRGGLLELSTTSS